MFKHILIATDGSEASEHASALAVGLARAHGAQLTALYVVDPYPYLGIGESNPIGFQAYIAAAEKHAGETHAKISELCRQTDAHVPLTCRVMQDSGAVQGIVQAAKDAGADLIVVGSHGRTGIVRMMLGSVSARVVAESPVPVLVVR